MYVQKIEDDIRGDIDNAHKKQARWFEAKEHFMDFLKALPEDVATQVNLYGSYNLDIYAYGDGVLLTKVVRALRTTGWETKNERPKENSETWFARFTHQYNDSKIDLTFSSTVCRKVKVGTVMKEVDVFEIQCGEPAPEESTGDSQL